MKEVTYKDWIKNSTPRMMWVWYSNVEDKVQAKVVSVVKTDACIYPVLSIMKDDVGYETFRHCAEIEKLGRMTQKELSRWLREKPTREYKRSSRTDIVVNHYYSYIEEDADQEVDKFFLIREDDGEWREPLVEVKE